VASALRNMLVRVGADVSGLRKGLQSAQKEVQFFGRNVTGSLKEMRGQIASIGATLGGGFLVKAGMEDAMRHEALMATLGESMGESRKDFEEWQETVGNSFGYSRLQAADTANILSLNFKKIATDQEDLVKKTTKMMEVAAIVSNKRGLTMQETSDRIRSAMNQEADGADELGVNVRISAIKTSQAYQEMADGQPWDKLTENMRKTILYHHILEQVSSNLGTTMQDTTALRMAQFTASLADVRMALGQAFLPIAYTVLPLLNKMTQALYRALQVVAGFMRSLFGGGFKYEAPVSQEGIDSTNAQADALDAMGESAEEAGDKTASSAKKAEKAWKGLFGFDEVNTIKDPETSTGGAGGAGAGGGIGELGGTDLDVPTPNFKPFEETIDGMAKKFDKFTRPIKNAFNTLWETISSYGMEKIKQLQEFWAENGGQIIKASQNVANIIGPIFTAIFKFIGNSIKLMIDGAILTFTGLLKFFSGVFTLDFSKTWEGLQETFMGVIKLMTGFWNLTFIGGIRKALLNFIKNSGKNISTFSQTIMKSFGTALENIKNFWKNLFTNIRGLLEDWRIFIFLKLAQVEKIFGELWALVLKGAKGALEKLKSIWSGIKDWFILNVITPIADEMENIKEAFSKGIGEGFKYIINQAIKGFNEALNVFNDLKNNTPFADKIPDLKLPYLAKGGITNGPTLAMVGDNVGGREVISPLDQLQGFVTNAVVQAMQLGNGNNGQSTGDIVLNIDGRTFARVVKPHLEKEANRVGNDVRIRTI
jgi:hypothetical protein